MIKINKYIFNSFYYGKGTVFGKVLLFPTIFFFKNNVPLFSKNKFQEFTSYKGHNLIHYSSHSISHHSNLGQKLSRGQHLMATPVFLGNQTWQINCSIQGLINQFFTLPFFQPISKTARTMLIKKKKMIETTMLYSKKKKLVKSFSRYLEKTKKVLE